MALDFNNQSDQDVQRLVEDLENVIQSPISDDMGIKQEWDFLFFFCRIRDFYEDRDIKLKRYF